MKNFNVFTAVHESSTATVPIILSTDTPIQMELSFFSEKLNFGSRTLSYTLPTKNTYKYVLSHNQLLYLVEPVLFDMALVSTAFCLVCSFFKKDSIECIFSLILNTVNEAGTQTTVAYEETFFCTFYESSLS
jgi:hypothetical protein